MTDLVSAFSLFYSEKAIPVCLPALTPGPVTLAGLWFPALGDSFNLTECRITKETNLWPYLRCS